MLVRLCTKVDMSQIAPNKFISVSLNSASKAEKLSYSNKPLKYTDNSEIQEVDNRNEIIQRVGFSFEI